MSARRVILVFVKWPEPGRVKTRLAADTGKAAAATIYRRLVERVVAILNQSPHDEIRLLFDPPERETEIGEWLRPLGDHSGATSFHPQASGDLGDRLRSAFDTVFKENPNSIVAAIGTDCIEIDPATFQDTWSALEKETDAVFGPARDGGYYLIGLRHPEPSLFSGIPWSTAETLPATLKNAEATGLRFTLLEEKSDIDTLADWNRSNQN